MSIRAIIIEDEPSIARHLERILLESDKEIVVSRVLGSIEDAVSWLGQHKETCDLIFSDIRLADGLSFEIYKQIPPTQPIIFITAFEEYTLEAFRTNGIHYVVKPFEEQDIINAIEKYEVLTAPKKGIVDEGTLTALIASLGERHSTNYKKAYLVHYQNKLIPVNVDDIAWLYTEHDVVYAQTFKNKTYTLEATLERIGSEISPVQFFRANRQFIVNKRAIRDIDFYFHGRLIVNVDPMPDHKIIVSKAKVPQFKQWMSSDTNPS
ncbi:MAG: LytTR family DNA-binding domain-containing protein [Bacteroidota bacterium]